jgi:hypothetical protein
MDYNGYANSDCRGDVPASDVGYTFKSYKQGGLQSQTPKLDATLLFSGQSELRFLMYIATTNGALPLSSVPISPAGTSKGGTLVSNAQAASPLLKLL